MTKAAAQVYASMDPDDFSQGGGGLFDDVDAVVTGAGFTKDPPNDNYKAEGDPIFFELAIQIDGAEESVSQSYPLGGQAGTKFEIASDDDGALVPADENSRVSGSSKFGKFMSVLKSEGFPMNTLGGPGGTMKNLVGLRAHFNRMPDEERKGLKTGAKANARPQTTLLVTKIHSLPGEAQAPAAKKSAAKTTAKAPAASAKAAAPASASVNIAELAKDALLGILIENNNEVQKSKLPLFASRALGHLEPKIKQDAVKMVFDEKFLATEDGWTFDKSSNPQMVKLA